MEKNLVIIPARGNSERLKRKNLLPLNGLSLLGHSINYAKSNINLIERIIVSSDNQEILDFAHNAGVDVLERPAELATATATTISVLKHVIESCNEKYSNVILLQPTNPLRPKGLLQEAMGKFINYKYESLFTVTRHHRKLGKIVGENFVPTNYYPGQRSQDMEPLYFEDGLLYIIKADLIRKEILMNKNSFPYIVDHPFSSVDIDTREDLDYAEYLIKKYC